MGLKYGSWCFEMLVESCYWTKEKVVEVGGSLCHGCVHWRKVLVCYGLEILWDLNGDVKKKGRWSVCEEGLNSSSWISIGGRGLSLPLEGVWPMLWQPTVGLLDWIERKKSFWAGTSKQWCRSLFAMLCNVNRGKEVFSVLSRQRGGSWKIRMREKSQSIKFYTTH